MRSQNYGQHAVLVFESGEPVMATLKRWLSDYTISRAALPRLAVCARSR